MMNALNMERSNDPGSADDQRDCRDDRPNQAICAT